ncbi:unnamed protein product, partial [Amoebophrya sp. A120]
ARDAVYGAKATYQTVARFYNVSYITCPSPELSLPPTNEPSETRVELFVMTG